MILKSMKLLNDKTCVKFVPRLQHQHQNYVYITKTPAYHPQNGYYTEEFPPWVIQRRIENEWGTTGCWSYLGRHVSNVWQCYKHSVSRLGKVGSLCSPGIELGTLARSVLTNTLCTLHREPAHIVLTQFSTQKMFCRREKAIIWVSCPNFNGTSF